MRQKIEEVLDKIRPMLNREGGDIELIDVTEDGVVKLKVESSCSG